MLMIHIKKMHSLIDVTEDGRVVDGGFVLL